ncbi:MAG TPA: circadian clock protein KaiC [Candidatus Binatia bacterium]|nr:circadian clock protein KaiC [Candidatus Binatia bacterium]
MVTIRKTNRNSHLLEKSPTGIQGFDDITFGGLPKGRPSLVAGTAGCGKTLFALEFLIRGATQFNEPGVFIAFEETAEELGKNVASIGFDLTRLRRQKKVHIDHIHVERSEIQETGEYDMDGLFIRLGHAIDSIGAKRVVLDTIEALFSAFSNEAILRAELRRLFRWLKERGVTAVITGERGEKAITRHGLEEYVADCVVLLEHLVIDQVSTRRLRVIKYRGSVHGTNEYPFLIDAAGFSVLPITSLGLTHAAPEERISSGVQRLDSMLGGKGFHRGSTVLVSGAAGSGKTSLAATFVDAACKRGEKVLYFAFEESPAQILRNMRSIGLHIESFIKKGLLQFHAHRPTYYGLEMHLVIIQKLVREFKPSVVILDPITNLINAAGNTLEVTSMLTRLIDFLKTNRITALFTSLTAGGEHAEQTEVGVSSLMDAWLLVRNIESGGERNRALYILKARGTAHSNQVREFRLTHRGIDLIDVYAGSGEVLVGSARLAQQAREEAEAMASAQELDRKRADFERKEKMISAQVAALEAELSAERENLNCLLKQEKSRLNSMERSRLEIAKQRQADAQQVANGNGH